MATGPEKLTLRALQGVDAKVDALLERSLEMTSRLGSLEDLLVRRQSGVSAPRADFVRIEHRLNRFDERLLGIEQRLI
jgi:hypothetical protein